MSAMEKLARNVKLHYKVGYLIKAQSRLHVVGGLLYRVKRIISPHFLWERILGILPGHLVSGKTVLLARSRLFWIKKD